MGLDLGCGSQSALDRTIHMALPSQTGMLTGKEQTAARARSTCHPAVIPQ